jgi:hypothetical protein
MVAEVEIGDGRSEMLGEGMLDARMRSGAIV